MEQGMIEVIAPNDNFYPPPINYTTLGDSLDRMRWRTKQNLDFIYLMLYCKNKGTYYLQLEDDVVAASGYFSKMKDIIQKYSKRKWFTLEFSRMGFIGKLFHQESLERMLTFLLMFYDQKPGDWLLSHYLELVSPCEVLFGCKLDRYRMLIRPSSFQHIGIHSSLSGKLQKIRARDFKGKTTYVLKHPSHNPEAHVTSTLKSSSGYSLQDVYRFYSFDKDFLFSAKNDAPVNHISIHFSRPLFAHKIVFETDQNLKEIFNKATLSFVHPNNTNHLNTEKTGHAMNETKIPTTWKASNESVPALTARAKSSHLCVKEIPSERPLFSLQITFPQKLSQSLVIRSIDIFAVMDKSKR